MKINITDIFKRYGIFLALIALMVFFAVSSDAFLAPSNLFNVARQVSMLGIAAVGMTFALLLGGIDLSIGSQITLVNIVSAWLMVKGGMNPVAASLLGIILSAALGFLNGLAIANLVSYHD
jgi:ribose transport system permease protein